MTSRKPTYMERKTWPGQSYVFEWTRQTCFRLNETRFCLLHSKAIQRVYQIWQVWLQLFRRQSCKRKENNSKTTIISALMRDEILANQQVQEWNNFRHLYKASSPCELTLAWNQTHISMKSTMSSFVLDLRYSWWSTPFLWIIDCIIKYTDTPLTSETQNNYGCIMQAIIVFHVKVKSERFTAAGSRCRQNLKYESWTTSLGRLRQKIAPKSVPHVQQDYFSSFNQSKSSICGVALALAAAVVIS